MCWRAERRGQVRAGSEVTGLAEAREKSADEGAKTKQTNTGSTLTTLFWMEHTAGWRGRVSSSSVCCSVANIL